jgi:hypothetical protein
MTFEKRSGGNIPSVSRHWIFDIKEACARLIHQKNSITVLCRKGLTESIAMVHCGVEQNPMQLLKRSKSEEDHPSYIKDS